jgi:glycosyltransferase involved in cell wall biosynthesis
MPTYNRRRFISQAVWYFLRQDYPSKELIILDDSEESVADLIPHDDRIRYTRLERRMSLGAKRNLACSLCQGDLIAHWDDDDWMSPDRLRIQVAHLQASDADVCGARDLLHYHIEAGQAWLYHYPPDERPWLSGCTLLYRRSAWQAHPFPEINVGEDTAFLWRLPPDRITAVPDSSFYIALIHPGNTGKKHLADPRWQQRSLDEVSRLLTFDRDFYITLRNGRPAQNRAVSRPSVSTITVGSQFNVSTGYGSMAEYLVLGMARAGATVNVAPISLNTAGLSSEFLDILRRSRPEPGSPALYFFWPRPELDRFRATNDLFINTMWEGSRLPAGWAERLNQARAVIVPTQFVARVCRESGVSVPIEVIPEGIDPDIYHYEQRPERPGITTLTVGPIDYRKHVPEGIAAWKEAFHGDPDARLIIKTQYNYQNYVPDDARIRYIDKFERTRGIMHWYRQADVLLALGNEGFGLPLVEAMAAGLPVIALTSEGQGDVCREAAEFLLPVDPVRWETHDNADFGRCGVHGVPGIQEVADRLRWVDAHRAEAQEMGRGASEWAVRNRNIWNKGPAVLEAMERFVQPSRSLRRIRTLWIPSWKSSCGVAEYTRHLAQALPPDIRISSRLPDAGALRLLHIQHEHSLFHDAELLGHLQRIRQGHIPVLITEHSIRPRVQAWEREADVLVANTPQGAETLRAKWSFKRVEHIPHGCPTWFPPRKSSPGKVIGAFGFLERHKGFWHLLDVLRALPGTELLMFSHAKSKANESAWSEASKGLPVHREGEFLPIEEVSRRLAAEADILVFWYDELDYFSASGAVRVALASGVPVLTSPTSWFRDISEATYQPKNLIEGVRRLLDDNPLQEHLTEAAREYCHVHSWVRTAERHLALWQTLE